MKKILKLIGKILLIVLIAVVGIVLLVWGGLNIAKFFLYSDYYSAKSDVCTNPGLNDGFVCQGIAVSEKDEKIIVSGYMKDKSESRLYVTDLKSNSHYVKLRRNGEVFTGHAGGVAITGDTIYIASGKKIYTVSLPSVLNAKDGDIIDIGDGTKVNNSASFVYTDENYLYVGEFHDGGAYVTDHPYETAEGMHYAIISKYPINDLSKPETSYGLADSVYYVYNEADAVDSGLTLDGAPVYLLDKCVKEIKGPAMSEDLDWYNGKVITLSESASNKYIFGKFFFATKIIALDLDK